MKKTKDFTETQFFKRVRARLKKKARRLTNAAKEAIMRKRGLATK